MNRKEIIKLAMDIDGHMNDYPGGINLKWDTLVEIVQTAISNEREACAKLVEEMIASVMIKPMPLRDIVAAIRQRGEK